MKRKIDVFRPGTMYPSLSTTGAACSLNCAHCSGHYLKGMVDVSGPGALFRFGSELDKGGGKGFLLSGGCDPGGRVVINDHILDQLSELKESTKLSINVHTGLVDESTALALGEVGVDVVSFDMVQDRSTIEEVLGIDAEPQDYIDSYQYLLDAGIRVVPHVLAGLHYGRLRGEREAVEVISRFGPDSTVLITLIPTKGTAMEGVDPVPEDDLIGLAGYMASRLSGSLMLGCMRPRHYRQLEIRSIEAGFSGIVSPGRGTLDHLGSKGYEIVEHEVCCAVPLGLNR